jgi:tetratricopeptide (TPR) repeat protein
MPSPLAAALYRAHKGKFTGHLNLTLGDRSSQLMVVDGDVVGAKLGFGHQTRAQALLVTGAISPDKLDALWARGEAGEVAGETLSEVTSETDAPVRQVLAGVRRVAELADACQFMPTQVQPMFAPIPGARAVRIVFELEPAEEKRYRCADLAACEPWILAEEDRTFLLGLDQFHQVPGLTREQGALLKVLEHAGRVEALTEEQWGERERAREEAEATAAAEAKRLQEERVREEARAAEEARQQEEQRLAEQARAAQALRQEEEARQVAEARAVELERERQLEAAEQARRAEEAKRIDDEARAAEERRLTEAEAARLAEESRAAAEASRLADERRLEEARRAEEEQARAVQEAQLAEEARLADAARVAEEARVVEARLAEEARVAEEARLAEEARAAEQTRLAEEQRQAAAVAAESPWKHEDTVRSAVLPETPPDESSWGDLVEGEVPVAEAVPAVDEMPTLSVDELTEPPPVPAPEEGHLMESARARAQEERIREMNEALRRAGALPADDWLSEPTGPRGIVAPQPEPVPANQRPTLTQIDAQSLFGEALEEEPSLWSVSTPSQGQPLILGRPAAPEAPATPAAPAVRPDEDLWKLVEYDKGQTLDASSFEEALQRVDASLEQIIGLDTAAATAESELPVEAIFEDVIEPDPAQGGRDNADGTLETSGLGASPSDEDWPFEDDLAGDPSDPAEAARLRRKRLLRRAMENLGSLGRAPTAADAPAPVEVAPAPAPESIPTPLPARVEEQELARFIDARYVLVETHRDHFAILGITRDATRDQVKAAYLKAAKVFHPDRLPSALLTMAPKMTAIFEAVREAYETLFDEARRAIYVHELNRPPAEQVTQGTQQGQRVESEASDAYKMGEALFRKRDYLGAEAQYDRAYGLDPKPTYLAAKAWSIYMDPSRKARAAEAKQQMADAVQKDPDCDRAHYQLGVIARVEGDMDRAERSFREAVRANPRHLEANQELRLIDMRRKNSGKRGLFG